MEFNKEERFACYTYLWLYLSSSNEFDDLYLCILSAEFISRMKHEPYIGAYQAIHLLPELLAQKPQKPKKSDSTWWPSNAKNKRLKAVEKALLLLDK